MAPSRKKGASRTSAAAAEAACRQWKVGDLVLAKVKGFPAWPATVSEPERWGYSTDVKKVLVYFFGTKQIAFCSPVDVEAFTEEKKKTLLIKRQGKGADFVRAVQEIIDSFEKLKRQDNVDAVSIVDDVNTSKDNNQMDFQSNHVLQARIDTPAVKVNSQTKTSDSAKDTVDPSLPDENAASAKELKSLDSGEALSGKLTDSVIPQALTYSSRRRSKCTQPQSGAGLQMKPSSRKSRSSLKIENCRSRCQTTATNDGDIKSIDVVVSSLQDGLLRSSCSGKYPDASNHIELEATAILADGNVDNVSEVATVVSDTCSFNEGSTCKFDCSDIVVECLGNDAGLNGELDLQIKSAVTRKKRQHTRKRIRNDTGTCSSQLSSGVVPDLLPEKHGKDPPVVENSIESVFRDDGDKHLPLVKRARVRMGESLSIKGKLDASVPEGGQCTMNVTESSLGQASLLNCIDTIPADREASPVKNAMSDASPSFHCDTVTGQVPLSRNPQRNQPSVFMVDCESDLPPSKRLHRALEAMSAITAEDRKMHSEHRLMHGEAPAKIENSSVLGCSNAPVEGKSRNCSRMKDAESLADDIYPCGTSRLSPSLSPRMGEVTAAHNMKVDICNQSALSSEDSSYHSCKEIHVEAMNCLDIAFQAGLSSGVGAVETAAEVQIPQHLSGYLEGMSESLKLNEGLPDQLQPSNDQSKKSNFETSNTGAGKPGSSYQELNCLKQARMSPQVPGADVTNKTSSSDNSKLLLHSAAADGDDIKSFDPQLNHNVRVNGMCNDVNRVEPKSSMKDVKASLSLKLSEVIISPAQQSLSCSPDANVEHFGVRDVSCITSTPSPANRVGSLKTMMCSLSSEGNKDIQMNGHYGPDVKKEQDKFIPYCKGKHDLGATQTSRIVKNKDSHPDASVLLKSFKAMLGGLTRAKENIGRATCVAIECAKCGVAAEVMEILAQNLETETSLHKRVDLFFLVDSIVQCSRGLKGNVGGIFPSIIQPVLSRLLSAAAPPGNAALENHRQCFKVLRLWLDRRILPESIIRVHMQKIDPSNRSSSIVSVSRRLLRTERSLNDPIREMDGMLVDEYGSNSSFQLPGFRMPRMRKDDDEETDSDGGDFEAVTPEHNSQTAEEKRTDPAIATEKHRHILEDVDGELEMEDVAPSSEEMNLDCNAAEAYTGGASRCLPEQQFSLPFGHPLPRKMLPSSPPLPTSSPPLAPPLPSSLPPSSGHPPIRSPPPAASHAFTNDADSEYCLGAHTTRGSFQQPVLQHSTSLRIEPAVSDAVPYNVNEHRDLQMPKQMSGPESSSFNGFPVPRSPKRPLNNVRAVDHSALHRRACHPQPPHAAQSHQFSYFQEPMPPRRYAEPPFCPSRRSFAQNMDRGDFYCGEERLKSAPYDRGDRCRFSASSFHGRLNLDEDRLSYTHDHFVGPRHESTRIPNQSWEFPSRGIRHRNFIPIGPTENAFPTEIRGARYWQPR